MHAPRLTTRRARCRWIPSGDSHSVVSPAGPSRSPIGRPLPAEVPRGDLSDRELQQVQRQEALLKDRGSRGGSPHMLPTPAPLPPGRGSPQPLHASRLLIPPAQPGGIVVKGAAKGKAPAGGSSAPKRGFGGSLARRFGRGDRAAAQRATAPGSGDWPGYS